MRIATIIGTRPQAIKSLQVSNALKTAGHTEYLVDTGQHYDKEMWDNMFLCFDIHLPPAPDDLLLSVRAFSPDVIMVYGDTDSTLQGVAVATLLDIPLVHVEAGLRSYDINMKEELNRVLADHHAVLNLCPTVQAVKNLAREGLGGFLVGDPLFDMFATWWTEAVSREHVSKHDTYAVMTVHRKENMGKLDEIVKKALALRMPVVWPVHPRVGLTHYPDPIFPIAPVDYLDMLNLISRASIVMTDSGGVQREAFWAGKDCIVLRERSEWGEICTTPGAPANIVRCLEEYYAGLRGSEHSRTATAG